MGHALAETLEGHRFVILDAHPRVGDAWRTRWDSLRLFTPARYCGLPGMKFPPAAATCSTKDEMADYLESYATRFHLPVRTSIRVNGLARRGNRFVVTAGDQAFEADNVVVAMANFQQPKVRRSRPSSTPRSGSCTRTTTAIPNSSRTARCSSSASATPAPRSRWRLARTHPTFLAGTKPAAHPVPNRQLHRPERRGPVHPLPRPPRPDRAHAVGQKGPHSLRHRGNTTHPHKAEGPRRAPASSASAGSPAWPMDSPSPRTVGCSSSPT